MRSTPLLFRHATLLLGCGLALGLFAVSGCSATTDATPDQQAEFRKAMSHKGFNINDVPEKDRARVRALMQANGQGVPGQTGAAPASAAR